MSTTVFFRDDDVGELTPGLRNVVEMLLEERVPCNYLVIPRFITAETAAYMRERRAKNPGRIELNQHGYLHEQVIRGVHDYSEFGGGRPYEEQREAIAEGRRILESVLGPDFSGGVFTPPAHKYDANTLRALRDCGFDIFSAGVRADLPGRAYYRVGHALERVILFGQRVSYHGARDPATGMVDISTAINIDEDYDRHGQRITKSFRQLEAEWERAKSLYPVVGVLMHHEHYANPERFAVLRELVRRIRREPVEFKTIEQIAAA